MKKFFLLMLMISQALLLSAQEAGERQKRPPLIRPSVKGEIKLPTPTANKSFRSTVNGITDFSLSYQYPVSRALYVGGGAKYGFFQINDLVINNRINANLQYIGPLLRFGFEEFVSPRVSWGFSIQSGYLFMGFSSNTCSQTGEKKRQQAAFIEPGFSLNMLSSDNLSFGLLVRYNWVLEEYGPDLVCLPNFSGMLAEDSEGFYQYFSLGFGFTAFLGDESKRKRRYTDFN